MISKKLKMIGLASVLSLGIIGTTIGVSQIDPSGVLAANPNEVHKLTAEINIQGINATMRVIGSHQNELNSPFNFTIQQINHPQQTVHERQYKFNWNISIGRGQKFYFQKITSMTVELNRSSPRSHEWKLFGRGQSTNGNSEGNVVRFNLYNNFKDIENFQINQKKSTSGFYCDLKKITIGFDCQNQ